MSLSPQTMEWLEWVNVTSFPLRRLDDAEAPVGFASGCLIDFRGRRFLLSVQHAVARHSKNWVVILGQSLTGSEYYKPSSFNYVAELTRGQQNVRDIDFCYAEVPLDLTGVYQYVTARGIFDERPRHIFQTNLDDLPTKDEIYAFSGEIKPEQHSPDVLAFEKHVYPGLRYDRTEGEFHIFKLPVEHPGHDHFHGCSGAPIVDRNRKLVALVCRGDEDDGTILGVSLARYRFAFDFICGMRSKS